jgi:hypothetical protein
VDSPSGVETAAPAATGVTVGGIRWSDPVAIVRRWTATGEAPPLEQLAVNRLSPSSDTLVQRRPSAPSPRHVAPTSPRGSDPGPTMRQLDWERVTASPHDAAASGEWFGSPVSPAVQRQADAAPAPETEPAPDTTTVTATAAATSGPAATTAPGAAGAAPSEADIDKWTRALYPPLRRRLCRDLLLDRERSGYSTDIRY